MQLRFKRLYSDAWTPVRKNPRDSGLDLCAYLPSQGFAIIQAGGRERFWTGIAVELPDGFEAQIRSRSGLTSQGIVACGGLGTIDNGYRGDVGITLFNLSFREFRVCHGDRIAQLVVCPVVYPELIEVDELSDTPRGTGGFGSTGV